jgi:hypothetical protein
MAFNQVLSPQFMIWLLPFAAVVVLEGKPLPGLLIVAAAALTSVFFPTAEYYEGLKLLRTLALLARNLLLLITWLWLIRDILREVRPAIPFSSPSAQQ